MKSDNIETQVIKLVNKTLSKYRKKISKKDVNVKLYNEGMIDSLDYIRIFNDVEKEFKIKIDIGLLDINFSVLSIKKIILKKILKK